MAELTQLGKYKVLEVLGKGAMGVVYKGFDPIIERPVALKTIRKELMDREMAGEIIARFKNEAQAAGRLTHPGIVAIYDYGEDESTAFIAMEFVQGRSLRECLARRETFTLQAVVSLMGELLRALDYAHENGVVHRDIKPANIIVMASGRLKVADFGIARIDRSSLTLIGSVMGTPSYMSPEQYTGVIVDRRSDIFSSGVVLYELLIGRKPFEGSTDTVAYKICHEPHRPPSEYKPPGLPTVFDAVMAKALAKKPEDRYCTAREFGDALLSAYEQRGSAASMEATVLNNVAPEPDMGAAPPQPRDAGSDIKGLVAIEALLAPYVGPIAKVLLRKAAGVARDGPQLVAMLADSITSETEKQAFLAAALAKLPGLTGLAGQSDPGRIGNTVKIQPLTPDDIAKAANELTPYLGPIAKIVAKKAAARAPDLRTLYLQLADSVTNVDDRKKFLKDAGYG